MNWIRLALFLLSFLLCTWTEAQVIIDSTLLEQEEIQVLHTKRGDVFFGFLQQFTTDSILFETQNQVSLRVARSQLEWLGPAREAKWLEGGHSPYEKTLRSTENKYLVRYENLAYSFTAIPYPKGLTEYRNIDLLFNTVDVGIGEHFSLGGGLFVPLVFVVRGKAAVSAADNLHFGLGINGFIGLGPVEGLFAHYFGIATVGNAQRNFNVTFGRLANWTDPNENQGFATVGGSLAFADKWRIYADVGLGVNEPGVLPSFVVSWAHRRNRVELGLLGIWDSFFEPIPILSYAHRF